MIGIYMLILIGIAALLMAGHRESEDITASAPPTDPTKDAYDV